MKVSGSPAARATWLAIRGEQLLEHHGGSGRQHHACVDVLRRSSASRPTQCHAACNSARGSAGDQAALSAPAVEKRLDRQSLHVRNGLEQPLQRPVPPGQRSIRAAISAAKARAQQPGRLAGDDRVGRDVARHHRIGADRPRRCRSTAPASPPRRGRSRHRGRSSRACPAAAAGTPRRRRDSGNIRSAGS